MLKIFKNNKLTSKSSVKRGKPVLIAPYQVTSYKIINNEDIIKIELFLFLFMEFPNLKEKIQLIIQGPSLNKI